MAKRKKPVASGERPDGRRQILLYMAPELIADLKREAMLEGVTAFHLVETAVRNLLKDRASKRR